MGVPPNSWMVYVRENPIVRNGSMDRIDIWSHATFQCEIVGNTSHKWIYSQISPRFCTMDHSEA